MGSAQVAALYRYPVKSMGGEPTDKLEVTSIGAAGDRNWAIIDLERRCIRTGKQWPQLLQLRATYVTPPVADAYDGAVSPIEIRSPDGTARRSSDGDVDEWLSEQIDRPVHLAARRPASDRAHYQLARARTAEDIAAELDLLDDEVVPDFGDTEDELLARCRRAASRSSRWRPSRP